jgi:hypothetical protein
MLMLMLRLRLWLMMWMRTITSMSEDEDEDEDDDELAVLYNGVRGEVDWRVDWRWVRGGLGKTLSSILITIHRRLVAT